MYVRGPLIRLRHRHFVIDGIDSFHFSKGQMLLRYPAREPARELDSVMEFGLNWGFYIQPFNEKRECFINWHF